MQRDLPASLTVTATYLGMKGSHPLQEFLPNTYPIGAVNPCPACPSGFVYLTSNGNSTRHAGTASVAPAAAQRLHRDRQYTLREGDSTTPTAFSGREPERRRPSRRTGSTSAPSAAPSNFDQRHLLTAQAQYTTGMGLGGGALLSGWRGALFKGWTRDDADHGRQRPAADADLSRGGAGTGVTGSIRPDYTGRARRRRRRAAISNPAALPRPAAGQWGNAGRNSITRAGDSSRLKPALGRTFPLGERVNARLADRRDQRAESCDLHRA